MLADLLERVGQGTHRLHRQAREITEVLLPALLYLASLGVAVVVEQVRLVIMVNQTVTAVLAKHRLFLVPLFPMLVEAVEALERLVQFQRGLAEQAEAAQEVLMQQQHLVLRILEAGVVEEVMPMLEQQIIKAAQAALALSSSSM